MKDFFVLFDCRKLAARVRKKVTVKYLCETINWSARISVKTIFKVKQTKDHRNVMEQIIYTGRKLMRETARNSIHVSAQFKRKKCATDVVSKRAHKHNLAECCRRTDTCRLLLLWWKQALGARTCDTMRLGPVYQAILFIFFFYLRAHNQHVDYSGAYNWWCSLLCWSGETGGVGGGEELL